MRFSTKGKLPSGGRRLVKKFALFPKPVYLDQNKEKYCWIWLENYWELQRVSEEYNEWFDDDPYAYDVWEGREHDLDLPRTKEHKR